MERPFTTPFKDEKTEVWRGQLTCPRQESQYVEMYTVHRIAWGTSFHVFLINTSHCT